MLASIVALTLSAWAQDPGDRIDEIIPDDIELGDAFCVAAPAGDVNGDGYADLAVGSSRDWDPYDDAAGAVYLFYGQEGGIDASDLDVYPGPDPTAYAQLGLTIDSAGDVDGDGFGDIIAGSRENTVYVMYGYAGGLFAAATDAIARDDTDPDYDEFGFTVAGAGDVDGDGYGDVLVTAIQYDHSSGAVYVYEGSHSGIDDGSEVRLTGEYDASSEFGYDTDRAGDVDGDGYPDVIIGRSGKAAIYFGGAGGLSETSTQELTEYGDDAVSFGTAVAGAGDVNADGFDDVIVGDPAATAAHAGGAAFVYLGTAGGVDTSTETVLSLASGEYKEEMGGAVDGGGDLDGDGYDDVIVGIPSYITAPVRVGHGTYVLYFGGSDGIDPVSGLRGEVGTSEDDNLGRTVAMLGDVNGDGAADIAAGAPGNDDAASNAGAVFVAYGACETTTTLYADRDGDSYGDVRSTTKACGPSPGFVSNHDDCDDDDPDLNPDTKWWPDLDGDGYGDGSPKTQCEQSTGYVPNDDDCDDSDAAVHPGAKERCNGVDDDCNRATDDDAVDASTWYRDSDGDGAGDAKSTTTGCEAPSGYVAGSDDCDDSSADVGPNATEACNQVDDDCDGTVDEGDACNSSGGHDGGKGGGGCSVPLHAPRPGASWIVGALVVLTTNRRVRRRRSAARGHSHTAARS